MTLPTFIAPMLASPGAFFQAEQYLYEPKWDGIRCLAFYDGQVRLMSRNAHDISARFPEFAELPAYVHGKSWVLDGELIVLDAQGKPSFDLVRNRNLLSQAAQIARKSATQPATLIAFDILYHQDEALLPLPLASRHARLHENVHPAALIQISPGMQNANYQFHQKMVAQGFEGTVIKDLASPYLPGQRTNRWIKVRQVAESDCVIGGYAAKATDSFHSLLLGQYAQEGNLVFVGHVGTGFTAAEQLAILSALKRLQRSTPSFTVIPRSATKGAVWVEPVLVCAIEHLTWTSEGMLRHPVFRSIRTDKLAIECKLPTGHPLRKGGGA